MEKINNTTWKHKAKNNAKDKIEVEIGDSKQPDFKPQVKIMRWDNECNVSIRLIDDNIDSIEQVGDKIKYSKKDKEVSFYQIDKKEVTNNEIYTEQTIVTKELDISSERLVSLYELNKHKNEKSNYAIIATLSEKAILFYGKQSYSSYYDELKYPVRRFLTTAKGNPMYDDGGLVWVFIMGRKLNQNIIEPFFDEIINELVSLGFKRKKFSVINGYKLFYEGKKLSSVNIEEGDFIAYVNYDCDYNMSMDLYKDGVDRDSSDEICRLKQYNENISIKLIENVIENILQIDYSKGNISESDEIIVKEKSLIAKESDWIEDVRRNDLKPNIYVPDGAMEFEITLKKKPKTNVIQFTLVDKDVEYLYQPELTQEEINKGFDRPDNVVGSYAVYAKKQKTNLVGGKEYKCGKIGHIFRPRIEDANEDWVWGELHIGNGILSVTIPQDFLNKAVYPIRHAAGLTFGYTGDGVSNSYYPADSNIFYGGMYATPAGLSGATVSSIHVYSKDAGGNGNYKGIITNSSKSILTNGVGGATVYPASLAWSYSSFSTAPSISSSTNYYLGVVASGGFYSNGMQIYGDSSGGTSLLDSSNNYTTPTNPTDGTGGTFKLSIYATYTSGSSSAIKTINELAKADVKTINGLAIGDVKSINELE